MAAVPDNTPYIPEGPMALPGNYTVKLTVDGTSYSQPVVLKQDPRLDDSSPTLDGMRRQLTLSQQIIAIVSASNAAYEQGHALDTQLTSLHSVASSKSAKTLHKRVAELIGNLKDAPLGLSGGSYAVPPVKGNTSFSRINGQASALLEMVEATSDQAPVPALYRAYSDLCRDFNATSAAWHSLQPMTAKLNARFKHGGDGQGITVKAVPQLTCETADNATAMHQ
jgi:hypothetical protein